ncbi:MAG: AAA family ATPase, partial [Clostridiales bacterium]|nr:AAA family ATPase [Clostridiales bacterium]
VCALNRKKNIVLQGPPGVGKTYSAKRLAYSMMGAADNERIKLVQFHQSYSYEDFIMGYRPTQKGGFELYKGVFYSFCKKAEQDKDRKYFFIIDEINRGNLSKIFGELFMLLEADKRGMELSLLYSGENFAIPENIYIIGTMNTADRSLALPDYALRRRFSFFNFEPAFSSESFRAFASGKHSTKLCRLISCVKELNEEIAGDGVLGSGFKIGHSYFCTDEETTDELLKSIVECELIPILSEYWFDEPHKFHKWSKTLRSAIL